MSVNFTRLEKLVFPLPFRRVLLLERQLSYSNGNCSGSLLVRTMGHLFSQFGLQGKHIM